MDYPSIGSIGVPNMNNKLLSVLIIIVLFLMTKGAVSYTEQNQFGSTRVVYPNKDGQATRGNLSINVLIDFGNTEYYWSDLNISADNNSALNATEKACDILEFDFNYSTSDYGAFVNGINEILNADDWSESWLLYYWNKTLDIWSLSPVGAGQFLMDDGASIAWIYDRWGDSPPVATPSNKDPVLIKSDILIDFGNGTYQWEDVILEGVWAATGQTQQTDNESDAKGRVVALSAFEKAVSELGLGLNVVDSTYGPYISGVDGIEGEGKWFWAVLEFANGSWRYAELGAGELSMKEDMALALYYTVWGYPLPVANPKNPFPAPERFQPKLTERAVEYMGNYTYEINLTVETEYNYPTEISFRIGDQSYPLTQDPTDGTWWITEVYVRNNFTYHFNSTMGASSVSTAANLSSPGTRNLWLDRKNAGEFSGNRVLFEVTSGTQETFYLENSYGSGLAKITVMGNGTLVARSMDWGEANGKTGAVGGDLEHLGFFMEITLNELECMDVEIPYDDALLPEGVDEEKLALYFWNVSSGEWERVDSTDVEKEKNLVWANVTHLTIFAPLAMVKGLGGEDAEDGGADLNIIILIIVVITLVVLFSVLLIWKKIKTTDDGTEIKSRNGPEVKSGNGPEVKSGNSQDK